MGFWSQVGLGVPEPKRQYRFLVMAGGFDPFIAKTVTKPGFEVSEIEHQYLVHKFYYPGRVTWKDVSLTVVDPGGETDTMQTIFNILRQSGFVPPVDPNDYRTISKGAATTSLGKIRIQQIENIEPPLPAGVGQPYAQGTNVTEEWVLYNPWIKDADFGEISYESDELSQITLTLRYDYALLNSANPDNTSITTVGDAFLPPF